MAVDLSEAEVQRSEFALWLGWTLATAAGMLLGLLPFALLFADLDLLWVRLLLPLWTGFLVGLFQWLVLRPYFTHSADWVLHGGAGWALGYAMGLLALQWVGELPFGALLAYLLFGLIVAGVQWPMLRREVPSTLAWVFASVLGWGLGAYLSQLVLSLLVSGGTVSQVLNTSVVGVVTGLVAGAVTGLALVWMARQPDRANAPAPAATAERQRAGEIRR
jgi:hypothetical protein